MSKTTWTIVLGAVLATASCASDPNLELLEGASGDDWESRRRRLDVVIRGDAEPLTQEAFSDQVRDHCVTLVQQSSSTFSGCMDTDVEAPTSCAKELCGVEIATCMSLIYLEISRSVTDTEVGPDLLVVPPQSTETNAGFDEQAALFAQTAITLAGQALRSASGDEVGSTSLCDQQDMGIPVASTDQNTGRELASALVEAAGLAERAVTQLAQDEAAVADSDLTSASNRAQGSREAWTAPVLSRLHSLHLTTGGEGFSQYERPAQYSVVMDEGVCPTDDCSDYDCKKARGLLSDSGADPQQWIDTDNVTIENLIEGTGTVAAGGGVAERLAERYSAPDIAGLDTDGFLERFGVTREAITRARAHARHEATIFDRDLEAEAPSPTLTVDEMGMPRTSNYIHFAASTSRPATPDPMLFIASGRAAQQEVDDRSGSIPTAGSAYPTVAYASRGLAHTLDYAQSVARQVINAGVLSESDVLDTVAVLVSQAETSGARRVESCYRYFNSKDELRVRVFGAESVGQVALVEGTSGLQCATTGLVEGQPCRMATYLVSTTDVAATTTEQRQGYNTYVELLVPSLPFPAPQRYYVVERIQGTADGAPGRWQSIGAVGLDTYVGSGENWSWCHTEPYDTITTQLAQVEYQPDPAKCGEPARDCFGAFRGPLPLEDELIDDGDAFETSWRHHLNVASAAADHADRLGEELIRSGLTNDQRSETSIDAIESMCGVRLNLDGLFSTGTAGVTTLGPLVNGTCPSPGCGAGYTCIGTRCVLDLLAEAAVDDYDATLLAECLGDDEIVDIVGLGSDPLCVRRDPTSTNILCEPEAGAERCPRRRPEGESCDPDEYTVTEDDLLMLFGRVDHAETLFGAPSIAPLECGLLRELRNAGLATFRPIELQREIVGSNFFAWENVKYWAQRIGWRGLPRDYSYLTLDGQPWYGTGQPFQEWATAEWPAGPSERWPCDETYLDGGAPTCSTSDTTSLFCGLNAQDCTSRTTRIALNDRMARAAVFLGIFSGVGLGSIGYPTQYNWADFDVSAMAGTAYLRDEDGGTWRVGQSGRWVDDVRSGIYAVPDVAQPVWDTRGSTAEQPMSFVSFGAQTGTHPESWAEQFWRYMSVAAPATAPAHVCISSTVGGAEDFLPQTLAGGLLSEDTLILQARDFDTNCRWEPITRSWEEDVYDTYVGGTPGLPDALFYRGNYTHIASEGFTRRNILDAFELMCEAAIAADTAYLCDPSRPPTIRTAEDLPQLRGFMSCLANRLERMGDELVLQNVPRRAVDEIQGDASSIIPPEGQYGQAVLGLRDSLRALSRYPRSIAVQIQGFSDDLRLVEIALANVESRRELADLSALSASLSQVAACASSGSANGAVANCANAAAQIAIQFRINELAHDDLIRAGNAELIRFNERYQERQGVLVELADDVLEASNDVNRHLATLRDIRRVGSREVARAFFASSDAHDRHSAVSTVMRRQYNTLRERYLGAHRSAVQLADLARRAMEQRLAVNMSELGAPGDSRATTLAGRPSEWVGSVCSSSGVDYSVIRSADAIPGDNYASAFVGDYVRNLENFFESYRIDYPATSGEDTMVVSLRDDIMGSRSDCPVTVPNMLGASNDLSLSIEPCPDGELSSVCAGGTDGQGPAWTVTGCAAESVGVDPSCVTTFNARDIPAVFGARVVERPRAWNVKFAPGTDGMGMTSVTYTNDAELGQTVSVGAGLYRLSWYGKVAGGLVTLLPANAVEARPVDPTAISPSSAVLQAEDVGDGWFRYVRFYQFPDGDVRVRVRPTATVNPTEQSVDLAGLQLENVDGRVFEAPTMITIDDLTSEPAQYLPLPFAATTAKATAIRPVCADRDGTTFRSRWSYRCDQLAGSGYSPTRDFTDHCYWETSFVLTPEATERLEQLSGAHVALGSFNYRIDTVAANFVGTGARACHDVANPASCYSSGFIPYSIEHQPPYQVRDWWGGIYEAPLVSGHIEQARGLAAERYITNPISSADSALLGDYFRRELRGRPLAGNFAVRVWDVPGVDFSGIEDVQLVVRYRYFTRTP